MLNDEESREYYRRILKILSESSLSWIIPQVQEEIAGGKIATKSLKEISLNQLEMFGGEKVRKSTSKENVSISESYTSKEQLLILLNAVEEVSDIYFIKNETFQSLKAFNENLTTVEFISDVGDAVPEFQTNIAIQEKDNDADLFKELKQIVQKIKSEI